MSQSDKRQRIAQETVDIYAPLAGRMGMQTIREELEDLAFKVLNPDAYRTIADRLKRLRRESGNMLLEIEDALKTKLEESHIKADVSGREKRPYSIWRKMERKQLSLGQLSDIFGFRVLVNTVDECYRALGIVHRTWRVVPGRFKDYISNPSRTTTARIHTTVIGPHHMRVEMQIRTFAMHEIAERGVAAHGLYKDIGSALEARKGVKLPAAESNAYRWLRRLVDMLSEGDNPKEFLEHTKLELFPDQVFCFTPKGDLIALPKGANAHRLRLCRPHRHRQQLRRLPHQWPPCAADDRSGEWRRGRDHPLAGPDAAGRLGRAGGHRQGPGGDPPRHPHGGAQPICRAWPRDHAAGAGPP